MTTESHIDEGGQGTFLAIGEREVVVRERLTIRKLAHKLKEIEQDKKCHEIALLGVESLDYNAICELCEVGDPENDPNLMPSRFMLLKGATDKALKAKGNLDAFPYELHKEAPETMSVRNLRRHLILEGFLAEELDDPKDASEDWELDTSIFDALRAHIDWAALAIEGPLDGGIHQVEAGECLSDIANAYGIREWRVLWELNKDVLGENWDILKENMELKLPDTRDNPLVKWFEEKGWEGYLGADSGYEYPGKYLSLTFLGQDRKPLQFKDDRGAAVSRRCEIYATGPVPALLHRLTLEKGDDLDVVIPDTPNIGLWIEQEGIAFNGTRWPDFETFQENGAGELYGLGACRDQEDDLPWIESEMEVDSKPTHAGTGTSEDAAKQMRSVGDSVQSLRNDVPDRPHLPASPF